MTMLLYLCISTVMAENPALSLNAVRKDKEITIDVSIANNPGIAVFLLELQFDKTKVTPISITSGTILNESKLISNIIKEDLTAMEKVTAYWLNPTDFTENGSLFTVKFLAKADVVGQADFSLYYKAGDIANQNFVDITPTITNTSVDFGGVASASPAVQPSTQPSNPSGNHSSGGSSTDKTPKPTNQPIITPEPVKTTLQFTDLDNYSWAKDEIYALSAEGIVKGVSDTEFAPQNFIKRADYMLLLVRMLGLDADVLENFEDVTSDKYYYKEVGIAKALGLTNGIGNQKFDPEGFITRQDMFVLAHRILQSQRVLLNNADQMAVEAFDDYEQIADYAKESIAVLAANEFIKGSDNQINPKANAIRAETTVFIYRIKQSL